MLQPKKVKNRGQVAPTLCSVGPPLPNDSPLLRQPPLMWEHDVNMAGQGDGSKKALVSEFENWYRCCPHQTSICLLEANSSVDGCTTLKFSLAGEQEFILRCPPSDGDRFLAEAGPRLHSWSKALNEFLLDSPVAPQLSEVLAKAVELYLQADSLESAKMEESVSLPSQEESANRLSCGGNNEADTAGTCEGSANSCDKLIAEFEEWNRNTKDEMLFLLESSSNTNGSACLRFSLAGEYEFVLHCPLSYSCREERFMVESSARLNSWSTVLNEFLMDSPNPLQLKDVLNKVVELYLKDRNAKMDDCSSEPEEEMSDDGSDNEVDMADEDIFTTEWELNVTRKKKRWMQKEVELREARKSKCGNLVDGLLGPSTQQIFSVHASSGVLTNDLIAIMEKGKELGIVADPVDDNIYCWCVKMSRFEHNSPLSEDLKIVHQLFDYKYVELQLDFTMDLYPFYPPQLKVIRPRLQGALMQRISNLELLKLSFWNPACNLINILLEIKDFVQQFARLETHWNRNCPKQFPEGAYLPIDHNLLRLAMVSEVSPRANSEFVLQVEKKSVNDKPKSCSSLKSILGGSANNVKREYWASGTGYGHQHRPGWDIAAYTAAQNLKDRQIEAVLVTIKEDLQKNPYCVAGQDQPPVQQTSEQLHSNGSENVMSDRAEDPYVVIEGSALIPFLELHLKVDSLLEVGRHVVLYDAIVNVVREIALRPSLVRLLGPLPRQNTSIHQLLENLKNQASSVLEKLDRANTKPEANDAAANMEEVDLARELCKVYNEVNGALKQQGIVSGLGNANSKSSIPEASPSTANGNSEEVTYCKCLKPLQSKYFQFQNLPKGKAQHAFSALAAKTILSPKQVMRIAQEISSLGDSLPLSLSSSIFVRMDENQCSLLKVLITGPEGTPYSGGCFQFDVYFPARYPQEPPKVLLMTTGKNTVRFNPNLYACGKVCLSLLGTWEGQKGEKWNETSTLLQVLISIQSLILVPEPYFNEPGYEVSIGTETGKAHSKSYNQNVVCNNVKWAMVDQLVHPSPGFEDVIKAHFTLRKNNLLKLVQDWAKEFNLKNLPKQLEDQLKLLPDVQE